jgi:hypothetical protein
MARRASRAERPEKAEERKFTSKVRLLRGEVLKQGGQGPYGMGGYSDRLALCPGGAAVFLEFKRIIDGKLEEPKERQKSRHRLLKKLGYRTYVVGTAKLAFKYCRIAMKEHGVPVKVRKRWRL